MEEGFIQTVLIVSVFCLAVIASGVHSIAKVYSYSGFTGDLYKNSVPFAGLRSDRENFTGDGQTEPPVFRNLGDLDTINTYLQGASSHQEGFDPELINKVEMRY